MPRKLTIDTSIATDIKSAASDSFKDNLKMIEVDKIKPCLDNFYSLNEIEILADDIERQGLKHNLVVTEDSDNPGTYFIKSGHRRYTAIQLLISENRYSSKFVPCLVDGSKKKAEGILDLIMLNATTRVMSDAELFKQYEVLKETLEQLKADGVKIKGRLREKVAEMLNVSPAQVGKIENIKHNAAPEIIEAVENGDMTIATADSIAKLPEEEQEEIIAEKPISEITTKDIKQRKEAPAASEIKEALPTPIASGTPNQFVSVKWDGDMFVDIIKKHLLLWISRKQKEAAAHMNNTEFTNLIRKGNLHHRSCVHGVSVRGSFDKISIEFVNPPNGSNIKEVTMSWTMAARHIRAWVSEENHEALKAYSANAKAAEENDNDEIITPTEILLPTDEEINAAAEKQAKLIKWAQTISQEQLDFLLNGGWYNSAIKGYLLLAAEEADFTQEQKNALLDGMLKALSNYNKVQAEKEYLGY